MRDEKIRLELQRLLIGGHRLIEATDCVIGQTQIIIISGHRTAYPDRLSDQVACRVIKPRLAGELPEQIQRLGASRLALEHLAARGLRLRHLREALMLPCASEQAVCHSGLRCDRCLLFAETSSS